MFLHIKSMSCGISKAEVKNMAISMLRVEEQPKPVFSICERCVWDSNKSALTFCEKCKEINKDYLDTRMLCTRVLRNNCWKCFCEISVGRDGFCNNCGVYQ